MSNFSLSELLNQSVTFVKMSTRWSFSFSKLLNLVEEVLYAHIVCALHGLQDDVDDAAAAAANVM